MNIKMIIKMAMKSIVSNKLRTLLTMLGIIIGVSSVIVMVSIGEGTSADIKENIESMGSNLLTVRLLSKSDRYNIDYEDMKSLEEFDSINRVAPKISGNVSIKYGLSDMDVTLTGVDSAYTEVNNYELEYGRNIVDLDIDEREKVVVIGSEIVQELFAGKNPLGQYIKVNGNKFLVVGVLKSKGSSMGMSNDEVILTPLTTAKRFFKLSNINDIYIQASSSESVEMAEQSINKFLLERMGNDPDNFRLFNQTETLETINSVTQSMSLMLGGIAAISLMVGGIGIMNIMLVSVTERTREIGVRKAIGAKRFNIMVQFLVESAVVSGLGGAIGIAGSYTIMYIMEKYFSMKVVTPIYIVVGSFAFSLIVGVFFGLYPADKASKLKPVDALRYE